MIVEVGNSDDPKRAILRWAIVRVINFSDTSTIRLNQSQVKFVFEQSRNPGTTVGVAV